jgi:hypothetical protein
MQHSALPIWLRAQDSAGQAPGSPPHALPNPAVARLAPLCIFVSRPRSNGNGETVAVNDAGTSFYFLCPPDKGYCDNGKCVFGRTAAVPRGAPAVCAPLTGCAAAAGGQPGCFPAGATVATRAGPKRMDELKVGDAVLAAGPGGALEFQEVYFFGHRDAAADAAFVRLGLEGGAALTLTPDHFVPVLPAGAAAGAAPRMTYAKDVRPGDSLLVLPPGGGALAPARVASAAAVAGKGLFNPYTLGGTLVVDGVLASAHSSWLLDAAAARLGLSHLLPGAFQALFAPLRGLYAAAGPAFMESFGDALAAAAQRFEAAAFAAAAGAHEGGAAAAAAAAAPAAAAAAAVALGAAAAAARKQRRA